MKARWLTRSLVKLVLLGGSTMKSRRRPDGLMAIGLILLLPCVFAGSYHDRRAADGVRLRIEKLHNGTFLATVLGGRDGNISDINDLYPHRQDNSDPTGALYYVVAVILMYGFSIILMIGSLIRKNKQDQQAHRYIKDITKVRRLEKKQEKLKTHLIMQSKQRTSRAASLSSVGENAHGQGSEERLLGHRHTLARSTSGLSTYSESSLSLFPSREEDIGASMLSINRPSSMPTSPCPSPLPQRPRLKPLIIPEVRIEGARSLESERNSSEKGGPRNPRPVLIPIVIQDIDGDCRAPRSPLLAPLPEVDEDSQHA